MESQNNENDELNLSNEKFLKTALAEDGILIFILNSKFIQSVYVFRQLFLNLMIKTKSKRELF